MMEFFGIGNLPLFVHPCYTEHSTYSKHFQITILIYVTFKWITLLLSTIIHDIGTVIMTTFTYIIYICICV